MRMSKFLPFALIVVVLGLAGCETKISKIQDRIQDRMAELRSQSPFQLGERAGRRDAIGLIIASSEPNWKTSVGEPTESDSIDAEALRRLGEEQPLFNGQYEDGFRDGWKGYFEDTGLQRVVIVNTGRRDFREGNEFNPGLYGFNDQAADDYRDGWNAAEDEATPVSGSIFDKDEDSKGGR